ncbi:MAG: efflux RND transporter periplasmic adaptor subunit [Polaribacter sp.]|nr:efflux RND transporter periplasmic adaptor subunit [Polaribacter sp.]
MKKYTTHIGILAAGLLLGWLLFGGTSADNLANDSVETSTENQQWTCSMHPQIMQPDSGDCPICGMDLILAETSADGLAIDQFKLTKNAMALANIQTFVIGAGGMAENTTVKLSGKIVENEEENVVQVSYFTGRIEKLHISATGEKVHKGQLLATLYSPELVAAQQELLTAMSLKKSQPELYKAVRNKLQLWKFSETQINSIESSKKVIENFPLYATVSGTISKKLVEEGMSVKQGRTLFKITNLNTVWAHFDVYENQLHLFKKGQKISVTTNTAMHKEFTSRISFIAPILNTKTRVVTVRAVLNNVNNALKPGMFVEGEVDVKASAKKEEVSIPETAVLWTGKRSVVYVKTSPNTPVFEMREITLGTKIGASYTILKGLKYGDEIVTNGTFTVDAAAQLQGKKSMMNASGERTTTGHEGHLGNATDHSTMITRIKVSTTFQSQLKKVVTIYLSLKDHLVGSDGVKTQEKAITLKAALSNVDMKLLTTEVAHKNWMAIESELKEAIEKVAKTTDVNKQRAAFVKLSSELIKAVQLIGVNQKIILQFCSMANNNKGAYWLSLETVVKNPYYGDAMLGCGEVKQVIE